MKVGLNKMDIRKCLKMQADGATMNEISAVLKIPVEIVSKFTPEAVEKAKNRYDRAVERSIKRRAENQKTAAILTESLKRTVIDEDTPDEEDFT